MYRIYKLNESPVVDFAAEELKKYLRMMMPRCGEIVVERKTDAKDGFRLGLMSDFGLDTSEAADISLDDILHIDTDETGGIIAGSNARSVLLAVYKYLTINGCRWLFPGIDGEFIPIKDIESTKYHKKADMRYRGQCNEGAESQQCMLETIDFSPKIGLNTYMLEFDNPSCYYDWYYSHECNSFNREPEPVSDETTLQWKRQCEAEIAKRGIMYHDIGHGWTVFPFGMKMWGDEKDKHVSEEFREYIALVDGKRDIIKNKPHNTNICMSNPKAREILANAIVDYARQATNVDYLNVWLADGRNAHCECDKCRVQKPGDWFIVLLNDIDAALEAENLDTRIVFNCYEDTVWPATKVTLNNPNRFLMNVAAIWRNFSKPVELLKENVELPEFNLNKNERVEDVEQIISAAKQWQKQCKMDMFIYDYHFWTHQCREVGGTLHAEVLHGDVKGFKANDFLGMIEDGSQRNFFPNGFSFYVYGNTLFDSSVSFDELKKDYFSRAYGEDWEVVYSFLRDVGNAFSYEYLEGKLSADPKKGKYYNPSHADDIRRVKKLVGEFRPFLKDHMNMPMRAQTVAYRILYRFLEYCEGLSEALVLKCLGAENEGRERYEKLLRDFGKYELELDRYYDQSLYGMTYTIYCDFFKGALKEQKKALNV